MKENRALAEQLWGADIGVLLGSGLGEVSDGLPVEASVSFTDIPGLGAAAVAGHRGLIERARLAGRQCLLIEGRRHYYETDRADPDPAAIRALIELVADAGVRLLVVTSASGSLDSALPPGRLVLVRDIIDLQMRRPVKRAYPPRNPVGTLVDAAIGRDLETAARRARVPLGRGIMACNAGPAYESAAEIGTLQRLGASVVTMSGAPELSICHEVGIRVASLALVTNWATGISDAPLTHGEVLEAARAGAGGLRLLIEQFVNNTKS